MVPLFEVSVREKGTDLLLFVRQSRHMLIIKFVHTFLLVNCQNYYWLYKININF